MRWYPAETGAWSPAEKMCTSPSTHTHFQATGQDGPTLPAWPRQHMEVVSEPTSPCRAHLCEHIWTHLWAGGCAAKAFIPSRATFSAGPSKVLRWRPASSGAGAPMACTGAGAGGAVVLPTPRQELFSVAPHREPNPERRGPTLRGEAGVESDPCRASARAGTYPARGRSPGRSAQRRCC